MKLIRRLAYAAFAAAVAVPVMAAYPEKPVKIVVAFSPGSGTDNIARYYATKLANELKQPFFVENKPGANGSIAASQVAKSPADGYTLFLGSNSTLSAAPFLFKKLSYDPINDFTPVVRLSDVPSILAVATTSPLRNFDDFVKEARAKPGAMTWAYANTAHLAAGMALAKRAKLDMVSVPYKSSPQALVDLIGGQVPAMVIDTSAGLAFVQQGKVRALAVTTAKPVSALPGVPTINESFPGVDVYSWIGLVGPAGLPEEAIKTINAAVIRINAREDTKKYLKDNAAAEPPPASSPQEFAAFTKAQLGIWQRLLKDANVEPE